MKRLLLLFVILLTAACGDTTVTGDGEITTEEREVEAFSRIQFATPGRMTIEPSDTYSLTIEGEDNILSAIVTRVADGVLVIETSGNLLIEPTEDLIFTLTTPELTAFVLSGTGEVNIGAYEAERFEFRVSGAGTVTMESLTAETVELDLTREGTVNINGGQVTTLDAFITSQGEIDTSNMQATFAEMGMGGDGEATIWVTDTLDVTISGAGDVNFYGDPTITEEIVGLGTINDFGEK